MAKRGKLEIFRDILLVVQSNRNSIKPTPLMRKSNLSTARFKEYYANLIERQLLREIRDNSGNMFVVLSERGFRFLERYRAIVDFIDEFEL